MSDSPDASSMASMFIGTLSATAIYTKTLEYVGPKLMATIGMDINLLTTLAVLGFALYAGSLYLRDTVTSLLHSYYSSTIQIQSQDPMFPALMEFLEEEGAFTHTRPEAKQIEPVTEKQAATKDSNPLRRRKTLKDSNILPGARNDLFFHATRHLEATMDDWSHYTMDYYDGSDSDADSSDLEEDIPSVRNRKKVRYAPAASHEDYFYYKPTGHTVTILREEVPNSAGSWWSRRPKETVTLTIFGKDPKPLKMLLEEVVERQNSKDHGRTVVYKARQAQEGSAEWIRCFSKPVRSLDTVILDQDQKDEIAEDLKEFLMPATSKWYSNRGLPYRRGYLLYGPPGTGKTSLSVALAGKYRLSLYSLSLSVAWMNDDTLALLFSDLPKNCIVLLEDIDACGITRAQDSTSESTNHTPSPTTPGNNNNTSNTPTPRVSFSGLLNAIDGVASKEGRVLVMTTNHRERLDEALIRPGRVDLQIKFAHADRNIIHGLFRAIYEISEADRSVLRFPKDFPEEDEIAELANEFAAKVPEGVFSPAEVQGHLLKYKKDPKKAVADVTAWAEQALADKKEKQRKEKEKEEKERKEKEKQERKERRRKEKEEREKKEKKEKEGEKDSSDDSEDEKDVDKKDNVNEKTEVGGKVNGITNGITNGIVVNGVKSVLVNDIKEVPAAVTAIEVVC